MRVRLRRGEYFCIRERLRIVLDDALSLSLPVAAGGAAADYVRYK